VGCLGGDFAILKYKIGVTMNFEWYLSLKINLKPKIFNNYCLSLGSCSHFKHIGIHTWGQQHEPHYLFMTEHNLIDWFICHVDISQTMAPFATFLIPLGSLQWLMVH
jgi:hypothetical protein